MVDFKSLPGEVFDYIAVLRKETSKYRHQRNGARREADRLRAENAELRARLAEVNA